MGPSVILFGWGTWIRTKIKRFRDARPAVRRYPNDNAPLGRLLLTVFESAGTRVKSFERIHEQHWGVKFEDELNF